MPGMGGAMVKKKAMMKKALDTKSVSAEGKGSKVAPSQDEADMEELNALDTMDLLEQMNKPNLPKTDSFKLDTSKPQSMLHVKREFKRFLNEFGIYMTWMLTFALTILLTRDNTMTFQFADLFRKALLTDAGWDEGITTVDNFWDFLLQDAGMVLANDLFTRQDDNFFAAESSFLYGNRRVGALRLRQVRVPPARCSSFYITRLLANEPETDEKKSIACYPAFSSGDKLEKTFKKEGDFQVIDTDTQPWFKFWTAKELNEMGSFSATFNSYPGSGFMIDVNDAWWNEAGDDLLMEISPLADDLTRLPPINVTISQLKESNWIDLKTRAVFFDFSFYNPNMNIFLVTRLVIEFLPSGILNMYDTFRTVDPFRYGTASTEELITLALFGAFSMLTFYYFTREARSLYRNPMKYLTSFWPLTTGFILLLALTLVGLTGYTIYMTRNIFDNLSASPDQGSLQSLGYLLDQEKNFSGILIVIMVIRVYKFCSVSRSLSTLTRTLGKSAKFLAVLIALFLVAAFGFALSTVLVLGQDNLNFASVSSSMFTLLLAGFGAFDQGEWMSNRFLGPLLLISWLFFANAFLLNIVVAVICEAFVEVTEENKEATEAGHMNLLDALWDLGPVRRLLELNKAKKAKIEKLENALTNIDMDGDGQTDMAELEAWLQETDAAELFGVADAAELMKKFDKDGTGLLDENEIARLKEFVAEKKRGIEHELEEIEEKQSGMGSRPPTSSRPPSGGMFRGKGGAGAGSFGGGGSMALEIKIHKIEQNVLGMSEQLTALTEMIHGIAENGGGFSGGDGDGVAPGTGRRMSSEVNGRSGKHTSARKMSHTSAGIRTASRYNGEGTVKTTAEKTIVEEL